MISCTVYRCLARPGNPCCISCDDKWCLNRCQNHPDRCRVWTETPDEELRPPRAKIDADEVVRLYREGWSAAKIAGQLGYTKEHICLTLRENGIHQRRSRQNVDRAEIRRLHEAGLLGKEIAARLGCSPSTVSLVLRERAGDEHG